MKKNWRFVYQDNMYWGSCEPCTASVFSTLVRNAVVKWKIDMRQAVRWAVRTGQPLDAFIALLNELDGLRLTTEGDTIFVNNK